MKSRLLVAALILSGCSEAPTDTNQQPQALGGTVTMDQLDEVRIAGRYQWNDEELRFEARVLEPFLITATLELHGMTIDSTLDTRDGNRMWTQDAFATDSGADTFISEEDQVLLFAFTKTIEQQYPDTISRGDGLAFHFGAVINYWAQWIPVMTPTRIKFEDRNRATDMCDWAKDTNGQWPTGSYPGPTGGDYKWGWYDGHDCSTCNGDPMQGQAASSCSSYTAYGNWDTPDTTWYLTGGSWSTSPNGHGGGSATKIEGACFGRYGQACGSGTAYFWENGSHDHCVRNGHVIVSGYCSDELLSTTQPYNCY